MRTSLRLACALSAAGLLIAGPLAACGGSTSGGSGDKSPIKVGLIVPLTGNYTALGSEDKKGAELAAKEINDAGGINGRQLQLITRDDQTKPDQSVLAFDDLKGQGVAAVVGSSFSNSSLAAIPQTDRAKLPYLSLAAADEQVDPVHKYVFMVPARASFYAERLLQYFQGIGQTKIAVAHDTKSAYAVAGYKATVAKAGQYGLQVVADASFDTQTQDFSPVFTRVRGTAAQALLVWATGPPAVTATKQFAAAKLGVGLVMTGAEASKLYIDPAGAAAEGVVMSSSVGVVGQALPDSPLKTTIGKLSTPYMAANSFYPPQFAFDGYCGVKLLAEALKKAKSTSGDDIQKALESLDVLTPNGRYKYTTTDHSGLGLANIAVVAVRGGKFEPVDWYRKQSATDLPS
jgi:branched-chain amino acid transport system substrate-binding protein